MKASNACAALAAFGLPWIATAMPAMADVKDYAFELVSSEASKGDGAEIAVRLLDRATRKPVPDAVIFARRIDMAPDGMATMDAPSRRCPRANPVSTASRPISEWRADGNCRWRRRCRARPAPSKAGWC